MVDWVTVLKLAVVVALSAAAWLAGEGWRR